MTQDQGWLKTEVYGTSWTVATPEFFRLDLTLIEPVWSCRASCASLCTHLQRQEKMSPLKHGQRESVEVGTGILTAIGCSEALAARLPLAAGDFVSAVSFEMLFETPGFGVASFH